MGSSSRLAKVLNDARRRAGDYFRQKPLLAYPAAGLAGVAAIAVCGLLVWLIASSTGSDTGGELSARDGSATPHATTAATPTATATISPDVLAAYFAALASASEPPSGPATEEEGPAAESSMRFRIPSIGVDAPVTVRSVGGSGQMGSPNGRFDVVWYDFSAYPNMGGYPGDGGNAVFSGHVDYHPSYQAVFWDLRLVAPGDVIEVVLPSGATVRYSVQWSETISHQSDFSSYVSRTGEDAITIVTCQGTFDSATRNYNNRLVVRGVRIP